MRLTSLAAAAVSFVAVTAPASADPSAYNGNWHVRLVTESGSCDHSYSSAIAIRDGVARYIPTADDTPTTVSGGVGPDGAVALTLQRSIATGSASGKLQRSSGSGTWHVAMLGCTGRWTATRRTSTASAE
jgi:hypothetical protein